MGHLKKKWVLKLLNIIIGLVICLEIVWRIVWNWLAISAKFVGNLWDIGVTLAQVKALGIIW